MAGHSGGSEPPSHAECAPATECRHQSRDVRHLTLLDGESIAFSDDSTKSFDRETESRGEPRAREVDRVDRRVGVGRVGGVYLSEPSREPVLPDQGECGARAVVPGVQVLVGSLIASRQ